MGDLADFLLPGYDWDSVDLKYANWDNVEEAGMAFTVDLFREDSAEGVELFNKLVVATVPVVECLCYTTLRIYLSLCSLGAHWVLFAGMPKCARAAARVSRVSK